MTRKKYTSKFKTKLVLEALKERSSVSELAQKYDIAPQQIHLWKREFLSGSRSDPRGHIAMHGKPEMINTDQGSQFTCETFSEYVTSQQIRLSMDGKGRAIDNIFIESHRGACSRWTLKKYSIG